MKIAALAALVLAALAAPASAQQQPPREFTIAVTGPDADLIWEALSKLPYERVAPLMSRIQVQVQAQLPKPPPPAPAPEPKPADKP